MDTKRIDDAFNKVETFYDTSVSDDEAKEFLENLKILIKIDLIS